MKRKCLVVTGSVDQLKTFFLYMQKLDRGYSDGKNSENSVWAISQNSKEIYIVQIFTAEGMFDTSQVKSHIRISCRLKKSISLRTAKRLVI